MMRIFYISLVLTSLFACSKDDIQPLGFEEVNFVTNPSAAQEFEYYYDDGDLVGFGLTDYVLKFETGSGTFSSQENLLVRYKTSINQLSDSIIPFTFFMGMKYNGELNKAVNVTYNLDYQYNNPAHQTYEEFVFLRKNVDKMRLFKINYEGLASVYYDPDITVEEVPFNLSNNNIQFSTSDKSALYGFCWLEKNWSDTVSMTYSGNVQTHIFQANRAQQEIPEGAAIYGDDLYLSYSAKSLYSEQNSTAQWSFESFNLVIHNPNLGVVDHENVICDLIVFKEDTSVDRYTNLSVNDNTVIEITKWPNLLEEGEITFSGQMFNEFQQSSSSVNMTLNFTRLR